MPVDFTEHALVIYVLIAARMIWMLPRWGRQVLTFLRELDDYRDNRPRN